jgi:hypothetical protein
MIYAPIIIFVAVFIIGLPFALIFEPELTKGRPPQMAELPTEKWAGREITAQRWTAYNEKRMGDYGRLTRLEYVYKTEGVQAAAEYAESIEDEMEGRDMRERIDDIIVLLKWNYTRH